MKILVLLCICSSTLVFSLPLKEQREARSSSSDSTVDEQRQVKGALKTVERLFVSQTPLYCHWSNEWNVNYVFHNSQNNALVRISPLNETDLDELINNVSLLYEKKAELEQSSFQSPENQALQVILDAAINDSCKLVR